MHRRRGECKQLLGSIHHSCWLCVNLFLMALLFTKTSQQFWFKSIPQRKCFLQKEMSMGKSSIMFSVYYNHFTVYLFFTLKSELFWIVVPLEQIQNFNESANPFCTTFLDWSILGKNGGRHLDCLGIRMDTLCDIVWMDNVF